MPLSQRKKARMIQAERQRKVNARSLNGKGYFMDAGDEDLARRYLATGDENLLNKLPDYPLLRRNS